MSAIDKITAPIHDEMAAFEPFFRNSLKSKAPLLDLVMRYLISRKGKQMRPMLVFLSAKLTGTITESVHTAAALIELLHTATLVHDDVVDESYQRRGFFSINALWKNKIAVLAGDYILSKGLLLAIDRGEFAALKIVSEAVREMAEGELLQLEKSRSMNITEDIYFEIITKKTATLIASCTAAGAQTAGANEATIQTMKKFGLYAGIAFQIKDDLFDYQPQGIIGKPTGNDIKEKKMTLPLIYSLQKASDSERKHYRNMISNHKRNAHRVNEIIDFVKKSGGIEYATDKMNEYKQKALDLLQSFDHSESRQALVEMMHYITDRKK